MSGETLYEVDPPSVFAWQPVGLLAEALEVSDRTIRTWASKSTLMPMPGGDGSGCVKRIRVSGKAFYRVERVDSEDHGDPTATEASGELPKGGVTPEMVELTLAWRQEAASLRDRILDASLEAERAKAETLEARLLAEVATRDVERFQAELAKAEAMLAEQRAEAREERQRTEAAQQRASLLERAAATPWYAFRRRRELREAADRPLLEG